MAEPRENRLQLLHSRGFPAFLAREEVSLAVTTYQANRLFLVGRRPSGEVSVFERRFERCMGLCIDGRSLWMGSRIALWRLVDALDPGRQNGDYDRVYVPQVGYVTGDVDAHDLAIDRNGELVFVNTVFSCLARPSTTSSFVPVWRPPFISRLAAEDRCHLNGLCMVDGEPAFVTCVAQTDVADGWRARRRDGGTVIDVRTDEVVAEGLSMPHSPRWHQGQLWLVEAGTGQLGRVDTTTGKFEPLTFCPGFARGLDFVGGYALVGVSKARDHTFEGLALQDALASRGAQARCGVLVVDLATGDVVDWMWLEGPLSEVYEVCAIPGARCPMALGFSTDEIARTIVIGDES